MPAEKLARLGFLPSDDDIVMHITASYAVAAPGLHSGTQESPFGRSATATAATAVHVTGQQGRDKLCSGQTDCSVPFLCCPWPAC